MSKFTIVKRKFTADEFDAYMAHVPIGDWVRRVVVHNTGAPSLAQRPGGILTPLHIDSLLTYYEGLGWNGGPHLFVDAQGIWVFNPLDLKGVHSPSFNKDSWGLEMLGDYSTESFSSGLGLDVHNVSVRAVAALFRRLGTTLDDDSFKFHRDDPKTTHQNCPGKNVDRATFKAEVLALLASDGHREPAMGTKIIVYRRGAGPEPAAVFDGQIRDGRAFADASILSNGTGLPLKGHGQVEVRNSVDSRFDVRYDAVTSKVYLIEKPTNS